MVLAPVSSHLLPLNLFWRTCHERGVLRFPLLSVNVCGVVHLGLFQNIQVTTVETLIFGTQSCNGVGFCSAQSWYRSAVWRLEFLSSVSKGEHALADLRRCHHFAHVVTVCPFLCRPRKQIPRSRCYHVAMLAATAGSTTWTSTSSKKSCHNTQKLVKSRSRLEHNSGVCSWCFTITIQTRHLATTNS
eukprot:6146346-Amphidinium_carterae.1